ncbi:moesin/ezrin/radixin protein [Aphelenchoides avenae]|nr:moesin/ezrin/radixin protein [Aphelenchus avenae]
MRPCLSPARAEYYEKNQDLKDRLIEFRSKIEGLKKEDRLTDHDKIHATNVQYGIDKYSSLRKSGAGSTKSRVQMFDGL